MTVQELTERLGLSVCSGSEGLGREIKGGYTSDLLSDVMGHAKEGDVWVTLQTHKNIMAIASLKDLAAIVLVKGRIPEEDTAAESEEEGIPILSAKEVSYEGESLSIDWEWSEPVPVFGAGSANDNYAREHGMCEVEAIRVDGLDESSPYYSEYGDAIVLLGRAERRTSNSLISVSTDEGETWTTIR